MKFKLLSQYLIQILQVCENYPGGGGGNEVFVNLSFFSLVYL